MSTTRSFSSGRPLIASTVIGLLMSRSLTRVLQASRLRPLMRMASEPQMPWPQERRNVSVPSISPLIFSSAVRTRSVGYSGTVYSSQCGSESTSGRNRRMRNVTSVATGIATGASTVAVISTYAPSAGIG